MSRAGGMGAEAGRAQALEGVAGEEVERVLTEEDQVEQMRLRVGGALAAFREAHVRAFPTVAPPAKRARSEAEEGSMRPDVVLPADTETDVRAPAAGKVMKLLALQKDARAGGVVVQMLVGEQETAVKAPSDGKVTQHHVKQGGAVAAGERLLTLTTSNALVNYVSALCRSTVISCALERAVPPDLTSGTSSVPWCPTRFTLVLGVLGVLTARVAIVRSRDKNAEASAVQRLGPKSLQEASTAMKPMTSVGAELGGTTPRGQPGASEGADVVMGEGADEGATVAAGGAKASKSQGMASWRIEALSIGGVTEHLAPYQQSSTAVFRAINEEAYAALHLLRREAAASKEPPQVNPFRPRAAAAAAPSGARGGVSGRRARSALGPAAAEARALPRPRQVLSTLVAWLANYRSLFSARCHVCRRVRRSSPPCPRPALQAAPGQCNADDAAAAPQILVAEEAIPSGHATTFGTAGSERAGEAGSTVHPFSSVHLILLRARRNNRRRFHALRCSSAHRKYSHASEPYRPPAGHNAT